MEIILKQDVDKIGKAGSVVKVKDGFARNFLFPKGLAIEVTQENIKALEAERKRKIIKSEKEKKEFEKIKEKLEGMSLTIPVLTQEDEHLYASITSQDIVRALKDDGITIEKNLIQMDEPIKSLGIFEIPVNLHPEVSAKIKVWIVKK